MVLNNTPCSSMQHLRHGHGLKCSTQHGQLSHMGVKPLAFIVAPKRRCVSVGKSPLHLTAQSRNSHAQPPNFKIAMQRLPWAPDIAMRGRAFLSKFFNRRAVALETKRPFHGRFGSKAVIGLVLQRIEPFRDARSTA
jgi:hypothetical protein